MNKILLTGYYGFNNYGDDLFPYVSGANFKNTTVYVLSPKIDGVSNAFFIVPDFLSLMYRSNSKFSKILRVLFLIYGAVLTRHVVLAGGSVLASDSSNNMRRLQYYLSRLGLCKLSAIGVSVGPFKKDKDIKFYKKFVSRLTNYFVRDDMSLQISKEALGVKPELYGDLVGTLQINENSVSRDGLGVSICEYPGFLSSGEMETETEQRNFFEIYSAIEKFHFETKSTIKIIILNSHEVMGDSSISKRLFSKLEAAGVKVEIHEYFSAKETAEKINNLDMYFTVRLHGAITAFILNNKFLHYEYHDKCTSFLEYISYHKPRVYGDIEAKTLFKALLDVRRSFDFNGNKEKAEEYRENSILNFERFKF